MATDTNLKIIEIPTSSAEVNHNIIHYGEGAHDYLNFVNDGNVLTVISFNPTDGRWVSTEFPADAQDMFDPVRYDLMDPNVFTVEEDQVDQEDFGRRREYYQQHGLLIPYPQLEKRVAERVVTLRARAGDSDASLRLLLSYLKAIFSDIPLSMQFSSYGEDVLMDACMDFYDALYKIDFKDGEPFPLIGTITNPHREHMISRHYNEERRRIKVPNDIAKLSYRLSEMEPDFVHDLYTDVEKFNEYLKANPKIEPSVLRQALILTVNGLASIENVGDIEEGDDDTLTPNVMASGRLIESYPVRTERERTGSTVKKVIRKLWSGFTEDEKENIRLLLLKSGLKIITTDDLLNGSTSIEFENQYPMSEAILGESAGLELNELRKKLDSASVLLQPHFRKPRASSDQEKSRIYLQGFLEKGGKLSQKRQEIFLRATGLMITDGEVVIAEATTDIADLAEQMECSFQNIAGAIDYVENQIGLRAHKGRKTKNDKGQWEWNQEKAQQALQVYLDEHNRLGVVQQDVLCKVFGLSIQNGQVTVVDSMIPASQVASEMGSTYKNTKNILAQARKKIKLVPNAAKKTEVPQLKLFNNENG